MNDSVFPANNMFGNPAESMMDFDYMDELLLDGCWLEATDGSEYINNNNNPIFDPWQTVEFNNFDHLLEDVQEDRAKSSTLMNLSVSQNQTEDGFQSKTHVSSLIGFHNQSENFLESSESTRRWWIPPSVNIGVKERLFYAIENIRHSSLNKNTLIQIWLPENREGKKVLSTSDTLFSLGPDCPQLSSYRNISAKYTFAAEGDSKDIIGLPGRVFMGKVPEWTPDVRFFKTDEYPRVVHAQQFDVRGSVAVPIFDQDSRSCLGVIEVVMTTQKSNYSPEIEGVCKALEAVDLRSSESSNSQKFKVNDGLYQAALPEILEILKSACKAHNLPLAQTWVPCIQQGKGGCRHSETNLIHCISTVDPACNVHDSRFKDFQEACSEHHLLKGQGVVGRAFRTNQPCYCPDVKLMTKTEYPLSHHAQVFGLCGAVAIRLRSTFAANIDYVLEFFLPVDCVDQDKQKSLLNSLSVIIQNVCRSLRIVTDKEILAHVNTEKIRSGYQHGETSGRQIGKLFVSVKEIGRGSNGTIVLEGSHDTRPVAVKRVLKSHHDVVSKEIQNLIDSDHLPNIVRYYGVEYDDDFIYIALERCICSLHELILPQTNPTVQLQQLTSEFESFKLPNGYPSPELLEVMRDTVTGLAHLHKLGFIHRDLKPQNVLICKYSSISAKVSDMGISKRLPADKSFLTGTTGYGSPGWQAPETLLNQPQTHAVDLFSLGCLLFFCITSGRHPFGDNIYERDAKILKNIKDLSSLVDNIPEAFDLVSNLIHPDAESRPSAEEVYHHPLFWDPDKRLSFFRDASDRVELEDRVPGSVLLTALESIGTVAFGSQWDDKLDSTLLNDLNSGRYRNYKYNKVRDLLRVIRNKCNHYRGLPEDVQAVLGEVPTGFEGYFSSRFPKLLMEVYKVLKQYCGEEKCLEKKYYEKRWIKHKLCCP